MTDASAREASVETEPILISNWMVTKKRQRDDSILDPQSTDPLANDILKFVRLVAHLGKAPWSNQRFAPNDDIMSRLIASHIKLVTDDSLTEEGIHPKYFALIV